MQVLRIPRNIIMGAPPIPAGHECCGNCYIDDSGGGVHVVDCRTAPYVPSCGTPICAPLSGSCTYNETAKTNDGDAFGAKACGSWCDESAGPEVVYDYASDDCA